MRPYSKNKTTISKMENKKAPKSLRTHYIDIEVVHEEDEEEENQENPKMAETKTDKKSNRTVNKMRDTKRPGSFSRQVSLETGFSVLNAGTNSSDKNDRNVLERSGKSFSGFGSAQRIGSVEGKKGDFNKFRTKSSLGRQSSRLPLKKEHSGLMDKVQENGDGNNGSVDDDDQNVNQSVSVGRYFAALRGPELDEVKDYEDILLPKDEVWPFLLRFPIGSFGICLGLSSQAILWRSLWISPTMKFLHIPPDINFYLWLVAVAILVAVSATYAIKATLFYEAVKREFFHPIRVNFFFAPSIVCMFLAIGVPQKISPSETLHPSIWCIFMGPILFLDLKIYGQWLSGGKRRLCKVANPSSHLSVVGNFVGAILAAKVGWKEAGKFLWAIGFAHYLVVFVTLYQRLPTSEALPKELHPVYSMFIATPAAASIAWKAIYGDSDGLSRTCYFIALFLFSSLVVRVNFFRGFKFSLAWWSYTFPMTTLAIATIKYAEDVPSPITKTFAVSLSLMSSAMVTVLFVSTLLHAFLWRTLFPNDLAIAISNRKYANKQKKPLKKAYNIRRWTKQASHASIIRKQNSADKDPQGEN